jgi:shikimate kinase
VQNEPLTIYVELMDEGTTCWRPTAAERVSEDIFRITGQIPEGEHWAFQPGEIVRCHDRHFSEIGGLVAYESVRDREISPIRRIVLTGFMGSGKTTVGPLVAARLGWRFVDVDDVIEAEAGCTIAELFTRDAEPAFRDREHATIVRLASEDALVLALGGGAIERNETRYLLLSTPGTLLVHLEVQLATTLARCSGTEHTRPVLADQANLAARYQRRLPLYRAAHVSISVDTLTPNEVSAAVVTAAGF